MVHRNGIENITSAEVMIQYNIIDSPNYRTNPYEI